MDTFFFMSTFLVTFHIIRHLKRNANIKKFLASVPFIYIKRLIRLLPLFYYIYLMYWQIGPMLINGANRPVNFQRRFEACDRTWWSDLLLIHNLGNPNHGGKFSGSSGCMTSAWYLDADTQVRLGEDFGAKDILV